MSPKPETILQTSIVKALRDMGVWVMVMNVTKRRGSRGVNCGEPGMPDLWTPLGWGEVKLPGEELRPDQVAWHERANKDGQRTAVWHSVTDCIQSVLLWRELDQALKERVSYAIRAERETQQSRQSK